MDNPFIKTPEPPQTPQAKSGYRWTRFIGYILFIGSVSAYAYATQLTWTELISASPYDNQLYIYVWSLAVCWLGSVLLLWKWFRFYQNYKPGLGSLMVSILPLLILPMAYGVFQLIKLVEASY